MCTEHYQKWKEQALKAKTIEEGRKSLEKAFFWLELQTAFLSLWSLEQAKGNDPVVKKRLIDAKTRLTKKLADYASETLNELGL